MAGKVRVYQHKARFREFLLLIFQKYHLSCMFCHREFGEDDLPTRTVDKLTIHHIDHNRDNNSPSNLVIVHRSCHKAYHNALEGNISDVEFEDKLWNTIPHQGL